jgi:hypothetical protein
VSVNGIARPFAGGSSGTDTANGDPSVEAFADTLADFIVEAVELSLNRTGGRETHAAESLEDDLMAGAYCDTKNQ